MKSKFQILVVIISFLGISYSSKSQLNLEELNVPEVGLTINAIAMTTESIGVTVGDFGTILFTSDGFTTWSIVATGTKKELFAVAFFDSTIGIAVGAGGAIFRTTTSGASWQSQASGVQDSLRSIAILGNRAIVVGGNGRILETTDKGISWTRKPSGYSGNLNSIKFYGKDKGIIVGENGLILRTTNGGQEWSRINSDSSAYLTLNSVDWSDENTITAVGFYSLILRSTDGGITWQKNISFPKLANSKFKRVYFVNQTLGFIGGIILTNGTPQTSVLWTTDAGATWNGQDSIPSLVKAQRTTLPIFSDFLAVSPTKFFAVGSDFIEDKTPVISSTDNSGKTWKFNLYQRNGWIHAYVGNKEYLLSGGYNDIAFLDNSNGIVAGFGGKMLKTTDGGDTWQNVQTNTERSIQRIAMFDKNTIAAMGDTCMVLLSNDGGQSWKEYYPLADSSSSLTLLKNGFPAFSFSDSRTLWLSGYNFRLIPQEKGMVFRTTDAGKTFTRVLISGADDDFYYSIVFKSSTHGWMSGYRKMATTRIPLMLHTIDGGMSWEEQSLPPLKTGEGLSVPMIFTDTLHGSIPILGIGEKSDGQAYFHTENGGKTWIRQEPYKYASPPLSMNGGSLSDISFSDELHGVILASHYLIHENQLHYTVNAGLSWKLADYSTDSKYFSREFYKLSYPTSKRCWVLGRPYRIFRLTLPETSSAEEEQPAADDIITLSPNPTSTSFTISGIDNILSVKILNSLGMEVSRKPLVVSGKQEVDVSDLVAGVYFVQVRTAVGIISKPVVITR